VLQKKRIHPAEFPFAASTSGREILRSVPKVLIVWSLGGAQIGMSDVTKKRR